MTKNIKLKVVLLGDSSSGKSSILNQYVNNNFIYNNLSTIGVDFFKKTVEVENTNYELFIWDTSGQEKFSSIVSSYYRNITAALIVFDLGNYNSFRNLKKWIDEVGQYCNKDIIIKIVGNKSDLVKREVIDRDIKMYCSEQNLDYIETSAKNNQNIDKLFDQLIIDIDSQLSQGLLFPSDRNGISIRDNFEYHHGTSLKSKKKTGCCIIL